MIRYLFSGNVFFVCSCVGHLTGITTEAIPIYRLMRLVRQGIHAITEQYAVDQGAIALAQIRLAVAIAVDAGHDDRLLAYPDPG